MLAHLAAYFNANRTYSGFDLQTCNANSQNAVQIAMLDVQIVFWSWMRFL